MNNLQNVLDQISLSDTTQREGRQAENFFFSAKDSILHDILINELGLDFLELNHPGSSPTLAKIAKDIVKLNLITKPVVHVRLNLRDILSAVEIGVKCINTYIPVSCNATKNDIETSINRSIENLNEILVITKKENIELRISVEHSFSLPLDILKNTYKKISSSGGIARVGMAETKGTCFPQKMYEYAKEIYSVIPENMPIQFHLHNDHGLAAANFLKILELISENKKKAVFDVSFFGLGERNGILSLGDTFSILYLLNSDKLKNRYKIEKYAKMYSFIKNKSGIPISRRDPLNSYAFCHSAAPHLTKMTKDESSYQDINPKDFGFKTRFNFGHCVTGYKGIQFFSRKELGIELDDDKAKIISAKIREEASKNGPFSKNRLKGFLNDLYH